MSLRHAPPLVPEPLALQNLAANALRDAPAGTSIELRARAAADGVAITVSDEGPGIAPEHLPHVFDRFFKGEASRAVRQADGGSGLELSIVKAIVERHGGRISITSRPGPHGGRDCGTA